MDITTEANYLLFGFKETGDATYLFKLTRVLTEFLDDVIDDYLESDGYEVSKPKDCVLKGINWTQDSTSKTYLTYRIGCQGKTPCLTSQISYHDAQIASRCVCPCTDV